MKIHEIDELIAELADENEFPFSRHRKAELTAISKASTGYTIAQTWEAAEKLQLERCWRALKTLRAQVNGDGKHG